VKVTALVWSIFLLLFSMGCDSMPGRPDPANRPLRPEQVKDFDVLYARNCAGCHGADGTLGAARALRDPLYLAWIDSTNLRLILEQGVYGTLMPAFSTFHGGNLTEEQIGILVTGSSPRGACHPTPRPSAIPRQGLRSTRSSALIVMGPAEKAAPCPVRSSIRPTFL
jgi:cytochrome c oxidase cbb3-type subunit 3